MKRKRVIGAPPRLPALTDQQMDQVRVWLEDIRSSFQDAAATSRQQLKISKAAQFERQLEYNINAVSVLSDVLYRLATEGRRRAKARGKDGAAAG